MLGALQLLAQRPPQRDDAGIRMRQVFERVDRDRTLPLLCFEIVGLALPLLVAALQKRARPDVGDGVGPRLPVRLRLAILKGPGDNADAAHILAVDQTSGAKEAKGFDRLNWSTTFRQEIAAVVEVPLNLNTWGSYKESDRLAHTDPSCRSVEQWMSTGIKPSR